MRKECGMKSYADGREEVCGKPSVIRAQIENSAGHVMSVVELCAEHYDWISTKFPEDCGFTVRPACDVLMIVLHPE